MRVNRHSIGFYDGLRASATAPSEREHRPGPAPAPVLPLEVMAAQLAADPEFRQWQGEERAAELGALTRRAHR